MAKRAIVPEGKALFFRSDGQPVAERPDIVEGTATRQSAIFLEERHLDWLEDKCREARRNGGRAIRKAAIIRALLDVAMQSQIDLTSLRRNEDIVDRIKEGLLRQ